MGVQRQFFLKEDNKGLGVDTNIVERAGDTLMRVFPVDNYEFPEEVKRQAREWHVLKVPLLGQQMLQGEQKPDWCGRTSASMVYNYFQLIKSGDPRPHYITHSRAGDPECLLDLRYPGGERAFYGPPYEPSLPKKGWAAIPDGGKYEIQSNFSQYHASDDGELPVPLSQLLADPKERPKGVGGVLRYRTSSDYSENIGHLLPRDLRHLADDIKKSEEQARERFAHLIDCLRANNPVVIYTGIGLRDRKNDVDPRHIIVICGYCILELGSVKQLWLVTADPSTKFELAKDLLPAPNAGGGVDLGHRLKPHHALFRMRSGLVADSYKLKGFASFNLVRATAFFEKNPQTLKTTEYDRILDHSDTHCGRYAYRQKRTDVPPEVVDSSFSRPKYSFPLRGNAASSHPWQCYYNNESLDTGIGGYYVLGLQRNLHGGVHLFPPANQAMAPVSAAAPGYVVAARLPAENSSSLAPEVAQALGSWPGFVLLRHEVEEPAGRKGTFYSLYMHLRSPVYPAATDPKQTRGALLDRYFRDVPWFQKLYRQRFGAWVCVSESAEAPPGTLRWAAGPVTDEDAKLPEAQGESAPRRLEVLREDGTTEPITVRTAKGRVQWVYKAPPGNLQAAMGALAHGKVATFDEPFFPVATGEVLGFAGPLPEERATPPANFQVPADPDVPGRRRQFTLRSGFLHFQVFCPEKDSENGIRLLTELAKQLDLGGARPIEFFEVTEDKEDNFLEVSEIQRHLTQALPPEDRAPFDKATKEVFEAADTITRSSMNYGTRVASLLDRNTSFAPEAEKPDWVSPCCRFAYPLKLEVETHFLPKPEQNRLASGGLYELELCFEQEVAGEWRRMECPRGGCGGEENGRKVCEPAVLQIDGNKLGAAKDGVIPLSLKVPALAERMTLKARGGFFIDQVLLRTPTDGRLLAEGITRRWRNVRLLQRSEWISENVKTVLEKVNASLGIETSEEARKLVAELAWCDPAREAHIARIPALSDQKPDAPGPKLFAADGRLAPGGRLENLHPVTAVWLLNVLDKQRKAWVRDDWTVPSFRQEDPSPLCAGWTVREAAPRVGEVVTAVVLDEDFGYDKQNRVTLLATQDGQELVLAGGREYGPGGNIVQAVQAGFWGKWSLVVADTAEPPRPLEPKAQPTFLSKTVTVDRPRLQGEQTPGEAVLTERPQRQADGSWRWRLPFEAAAPRELSAFLLLRTDTRESGPGSPYPERVLPVTVRAVVDTPVPVIDEKQFVLEGPAGEAEFITGLTTEGHSVLLKEKERLYVIEGHVRYKDCLAAMDIQVGWGLVKGLRQLAAKNVPFTLLHLSADGQACTLQSAADLERFKVAGARTLTRSFQGDIKLEFDLMVCDEPKASSAWVFDAERQHVLNCIPSARGSKLGARKFSEFQAVYRKEHGERLHVGLAAALWHAEKALGKLPLVIERIEASGMSCVIDASGKGAVDRVRAAAASGGFEVTEADPAKKSRLRLTVDPAAKNQAVATFHPGRIFESLNKSELPPGMELFYWFELVALNGQAFLHRSPGENTGEGDGSLPLAEFEALKAKTSEPIRATHEGPGRYRKVALREQVAATDKEPARHLAFKPAPRLGQCELELSACVRGAPEDLNRYTATFSRKAPKGTKWEPLKGFTKLRPEKLDLQGDNSVAEWRVSARIPYPQTPVEGATEFKLELVSDSVDCEPQQLEATGTYNFKPRWESALKVEQKGELLELRCHGEGLEVPLPGSKDERAWNVAREFEIVIKPDKADPHLEGIKPKLSEHLRYATPKPDGKRGGCDLEGDFVATLDLKALEPGVPYTFTLQRANKSPVRQTVIPPVESAPFTRTRDEE
ncbi:hypothetical protein JY651_42390 [Pyxidicoccus parkwayensis]|uniref:Uncharacterized protein n=1 Tax=Pyxidicoccus parkwayensis TaxID=2813578 RepID=A0ABX7NS71_9BACT|nr:hypothetical protein [Pyxidicoccus parkwaysis]QSQ21737.1 hypothetical protein JY651_42390 [Pyxidicoccus parkwaysis]